MDVPSSSDALKLEIARLTGAINRAKTSVPTVQPPSTGYQPTPRSHVYVNPNYKPPSKPERPSSSVIRPVQPQVRPPASRPPVSSAEKKEVVIGGVAFESSGRSLVRKDLPKPAASAPVKRFSRPRPRAEYVRNQEGYLINTSRVYKSRTSARPRPGGRAPRNMTLKNNVRPYQARKLSKRLKYSDKPCPRFTTTGACSRGLTCMYQHDPDKIAICWNFLHGKCPNTSETCDLSHDPTPQRTPVCMHFANNGRCTRENCPFPHVRLGPRQGVCRDFAVLGYCEKGLDCDKNHVRECPDFAEKGACTTKGCKLPHVIRANRTRKPPSATSPNQPIAAITSIVDSGSSPDTDDTSRLQSATAGDAQIGDEYISLTFHEDDETEDGSDEENEEEEDSDEDEEEATEEKKEGEDPNDEDEMYVHG